MTADGPYVVIVSTQAPTHMICPVCGAPDPDVQPVGDSVTVFCCPACVQGVLRTFARHAQPPHGGQPRVPRELEAVAVTA